MRDEWVLDVLADLRNFAQKNGLNALADRLVETRQVAESELAQRPATRESAGVDRQPHRS